MRIYKRGKSWYIDYIYKGKRKRKKIGSDKKTAGLVLKDIELKIVKGEFLGIHETKKVLFEEFAEEYLEFSKVNKAKTSYERDIFSLKVQLIPYFEGYYLTDISPQEIEDYKTKRLEEVSPTTINRELACLKHLFSKAIERGFAVDNPVKKIKLFKEPPGRVRYLEEEEITGLLEECPQPLRTIVVVALNTGMRKSEIFNLKWRDISFRHRTITIRNSKNNELRIIPMNDMVIDTLKKLVSFGDYIFLGRKGGPYKDIQQSFKAALKRAGIEDFRFHDLRHTFSSHLAMNGWNIQTIKQLLGHKTIRMTMRYSHLSGSHLQEAINSLTRNFQVGTDMAQKRKPLNLDIRKSLDNKRTEVDRGWCLYWTSNPAFPTVSGR